MNLFPLSLDGVLTFAAWGRCAGTKFCKYNNRIKASQYHRFWKSRNRIKQFYREDSAEDNGGKTNFTLKTNKKMEVIPRCR